MTIEYRKSSPPPRKHPYASNTPRTDKHGEKLPSIASIAEAVEKLGYPKTAKAMRKRGEATGTPVQVRLQPELLALLDASRGALSRPEAIRQALETYYGRPKDKDSGPDRTAGE